MSVNLHYEDKARSAGFSSVCGVDEAGAGPLKQKKCKRQKQNLNVDLKLCKYTS